jgi:hypothetical protein
MILRRRKMKKLFLVWMLLSVWFPGLLMPQTYEDGISSYKKANVAKVMNDQEGERKALEKAYRIFKDLASATDEKSIVMYYLMSLKLKKEFIDKDLLIEYVKKEHPDYPTIEKLEFYGEDKKLARDNIKRIARQHENEEKAKKLMEQTKNMEGKSSSKGSFALFIDGGIGGNFKIDSFDYGWNWGTDDVSINEGGTVKVDPESGTSIGFSFGMMKLFSPSWGVSVSVSSFNQKFNSESDYQFSWVWYTNEGYSIDENFTDSGKITLMPINLNLIAVLRLGTSAGINFYAGPTLYLTKVDLKSHVGYSVTGTKSDGYVYVDWFPYEFEISESASIFGANAGLDFEYILGNNIGVYVGIQYFYVPKKEYNWQLIIKRYDGEFGNFYISDPSGNELLENFNSEINLSTYKAHLGFKIYF